MKSVVLAAALGDYITQLLLQLLPGSTTERAGADESLSHLLFDCPASQAARRVMFDQIKGVEGCDAKLTACLSIQNEKERVCRFVSDDIWGSADTLQCVLPCITQ